MFQVKKITKGKLIHYKREVLQLNHKKRFGYFITESFVLPHNQSTETL